MAEIKKPKSGKPGDIWEVPQRSTDDTVANIKSASEFFDVPIEDFLYYSIADLIYTDLKAMKVLKFRARKSKVLPMIMERIALSEYGKELLKNDNRSKSKA